MIEEGSSTPVFDADDIKQVLEGWILYHHHNNIERLEMLGENLGYPVLLLTMTAMDLVASLCSDSSLTLEDYFDVFMRTINPIYGVRFSPNLKKVDDRKGKMKTLEESSREYTNMGTIFREALRNRLVHSCGSVLEIDARKSMEHLHMTVRGTHHGSKWLFVHAYRLYHDYRKSLEHLYAKLKTDKCLLKTVRENLGREWAHIMLMENAVSEIIEQHLSISTFESSDLKLKDEQDVLDRLQRIGRSHILSEREE